MRNLFFTFSIKLLTTYLQNNLQFFTKLKNIVKNLTINAYKNMYVGIIEIFVFFFLWYIYLHFF